MKKANFIYLCVFQTFIFSSHSRQTKRRIYYETTIYDNVKQDFKMFFSSFFFFFTFGFYNQDCLPLLILPLRIYLFVCFFVLGIGQFDAVTLYTHSHTITKVHSFLTK
uniref:Uncharacterized protein n=1 Tax=Octopus bimaculoides TaxID=37653 RepID=A0A0L8HLI5_OCTBM